MCEYCGLCPTYQYPIAKRPRTVLFARRILRKEFDTLGSGCEHSTAKVTPNSQSHAIETKISNNFFRAADDFATPRTGTRPL